GRNSVDADTGQVGPELAELLDWAFVTAARHLAIDVDAAVVNARSETDDGFVQLRTSLPAVVSCAERLIEPSKVDASGRAAVAAAVTVVVEPARLELTTELLGQAARFAERVDGHVVAFGAGALEAHELGALGADLVVDHDASVEEDVAAALGDWCAAAPA